MAYGKCLLGVIEYAKGLGSDEKDIKKLIKNIKKKVDLEKSSNPAFAKDDFLKDLQNQYNKELDASKKLYNISLKNNILKQKRIFDTVSAAKDVHKALNDFLVFGKQSVLNLQLTIKSTLLGMLGRIGDAELAGLKSADLDIEIAEDAKFNNSQNKTVKSINQKLSKIYNYINQQFKDEGVYVGEVEGWRYTQAHNQSNLRKIDQNPALELNTVQKFFSKFGRGMSPAERFELSFKRWHDFVLSKIDRAKTGIENLSDEDTSKWLREFYSNVLTNVHTSLQSANPKVFSGANLLNKITAERQLFFNAPRDEIEYAREYGHGSLYQNILRNLETAARNIGVVRKLGTSPEGLLDNIKNKLIKANKENPDLVDKLRGRTLQTSVELVTGHYKMAADRGVSQALANLRSFTACVKFASSNFTAFFMDPIGRAAFLVNNTGENWMSAYFKAYSEMFQYIKESRENIKNYTDASVTHTIAGFQSRIGQDTLPSKAIAKLQDLTFKLNGLHYLDQARTEGVVMAEGNAMANFMDKDFGSLTPERQKTYQAYGLGEDEFNVMKNGVVKESESGKKYLFADSIRDISDADLKDYAVGKGMTINKARNELETKLSNYYRDAAGYIVMDGEAPIIRFMQNYFGGPGTFGGEFMRTAMLGLSWPVQYTTKVIWPMLNHGTFANRAKGVAALTVISTTMELLKDLTSNFITRSEYPDDFSDPKLLWEAFQKSGPLGMISTVLFDYLPNPSDSVPLAFKNLYNVMKIPYDALSSNPSESTDASLELTKWIYSNSPFVNLPYAKLALDHLLLYQMQEMISPGSVDKMQAASEARGNDYLWEN